MSHSSRESSYIPRPEQAYLNYLDKYHRPEHIPAHVRDRRNRELQEKRELVKLKAIRRENAVGNEKYDVSPQQELRNIYTVQEQRLLEKQQEASDITQGNTVSVNIRIPPYGADKEYKGMIGEMLIRLGRSGIIPPTDTGYGEIESSTLAMFCHNNRADYMKFADKLKRILPNTTSLNVDGKICDSGCIKKILDDICEYKGMGLAGHVARLKPPSPPDLLALYNKPPSPPDLLALFNNPPKGGRRSKSKTKTKSKSKTKSKTKTKTKSKTKNNKYKIRRTNSKRGKHSGSRRYRKK
jgi:hypothetical protein